MFLFQFDYSARGATYDFLRKVMALPFLPAAQIQTAFNALKKKVTTPKLLAFMEYVEKNWILHRTFKPENWSVFRMSIRTNNGGY